MQYSRDNEQDVNPQAEPASPEEWKPVMVNKWVEILKLDNMQTVETDVEGSPRIDLFAELSEELGELVDKAFPEADESIEAQQWRFRADQISGTAETRIYKDLEVQSLRAWGESLTEDDDLPEQLGSESDERYRARLERWAEYQAEAHSKKDPKLESNTRQPGQSFDL